MLIRKIVFKIESLLVKEMRQMSKECLIKVAKSKANEQDDDSYESNVTLINCSIYLRFSNFNQTFFGHLSRFLNKQ
jgi:hypothetical protein